MKSSTISLALLAISIAHPACAIGLAGSNPNNPLPTWNPNPSLVYPTGDTHGPISGLPIGSDLPGFTDPRGRIPALPSHHLSAPVQTDMAIYPNFNIQAADGSLSPASASNLLDIYRPGELHRLIHWPNTSLQTLMPGAVQGGYLNSDPRPFPKVSPPSYGAYWMGFADPPPTHPDRSPPYSATSTTHVGGMSSVGGVSDSDSPPSRSETLPTVVASSESEAPPASFISKAEAPTSPFDPATHNRDKLSPTQIANYAEYQRQQNARWQKINFDQPGANRRGLAPFAESSEQKVPVPFTDTWWQVHPHVRFSFDGSKNWWASAEWKTVAAWLPWEWPEADYYNYGQNVYYKGDAVYYGDQPFATTEQYVAQAQAIATSIPNQTPASNDWLPLGVFAVLSDGDEPLLFLQLALSKSGILAGTLQVAGHARVESIEGAVDKLSQRAAWTVAGAPRPLMEAGLANLTQATAPLLIHFADDTTQQWLLVRINKPIAASEK